MDGAAAKQMMMIEGARQCQQLHCAVDGQEFRRQENEGQRQSYVGPTESIVNVTTLPIKDEPEILPQENVQLFRDQPIEQFTQHDGVGGEAANQEEMERRELLGRSNEQIPAQMPYQIQPNAQYHTINELQPTNQQDFNQAKYNAQVTSLATIQPMLEPSQG